MSKSSSAKSGHSLITASYRHDSRGPAREMSNYVENFPNSRTVFTNPSQHDVEKFMRHLKWLCALTAMLCLSGCGTLLRTLLAPEETVFDAASDVANATSQGLTGALPPEAVDSSATISDLDRIIAEHPDAANVGELAALKEQLQADQASQIAAQTKAKRKSGRRETEPERATPDAEYHSYRRPSEDRRETDEPPGLFSRFIIFNGGRQQTENQRKLRLDRLPLIGAETAQEHSHSNPFAEIRSSTLRPWQPRMYLLPMDAKIYR